MNLFLDLDGTLLDSKPRLYKLFNFLVPESELSFEQYWQLKKNAIGHIEILKNTFQYDDILINRFQHQWLNLIEHPDWIHYDQPITGVTEKLKELKRNCELILVTARQYHQIANEQVARFKWTEYFKLVLVTEQKEEKEHLILHYIKPSQYDWFIGDTGKDIQAGKVLNIHTAAVLSGFRSRNNLEKYRPDLILDSILDFTIDNPISNR